MNARQKHVKRAIEYLTRYMNTYDKQTGYLDYTDETIINDVLYGLGVAIGGREYQMADGFAKFKARLAKHIANASGEHSPGAAAEGDMLDPVVVPDFAPGTAPEKN